MVQKYFAITMISAAAMALSACEAGRDWRMPNWKDEGAIKVTNADTGAPEPQDLPAPIAPVTSTSLAGGQSGKFPPPNERDLMIMTDKLSGGSVEIYDLNGPAPRAYGSSVEMAYGGGMGMPAATDSSVMVFPIEGSTYPGQISASWPNSVLPNSASGDYNSGGSHATGGRTSPRVGSGYTPSQIFFKHGSSRLGSGDKQVLGKVADQAKFAPVDRISVEGHASKRTGVSDPVESKIVNLKESMSRAFNVSSELMREGVPAEKIKTTVWGDTKNSGGTEAENRRVDIITGAQ